MTLAHTRGADYSLDYLLAVARGSVTGAEQFDGFGERVTTGAVTNGLVWPNGAMYIPAAGGVQPTIVSTSANDAAAGTGIRSVHIHYLDDTLTPQQLTVVLNGLTPVTLPVANVRFIQKLHAYTVGATGYAAGNITVNFAGGTLAMLGANDIKSRSSFRMVPKGKYAFVDDIHAGAVSGTAASQVHVELVATEEDEHQFTQQGLFFAKGEIALQDNNGDVSFKVPLRFREGTIIGATFTCDKACLVTASWHGWLEDA